ncbi:MAG: hypothetical protein QOG06_455 [Gaiellaceae bacterium]|nr:hypothetical protein [Gaiellaceae bacterium]
MNACATFVGKVVRAHDVAPDGDLTFTVARDPAYASMLNAKNRSKGGIHMEIVPIDQLGCRSVCSGLRVATPPVGARVRLTGAYVYDRWVGWNEIHPTWKVEILSGGPPPPPPQRLQVFHLKAHLSGKSLRRHGARYGRGQVALRLKAGTVCWRFTHLTRVGSPTRAAIRLKRRGQPGRSVLALEKRYRRQGCVTASGTLFESLVEKPARYYVLVASKHHRYGALLGRLKPARPRSLLDAY